MPVGPNAPYTALDQNQILQRCFEETDDRLRVDAQVSVTLGTVACEINASSGDNIAITNQDGSNPLVINSGGSINAIVSSTNLDIRDLTFATDKVDVSGSSVTVSSTDLDIRDLSHVQDSVKIGNGTNFLNINASGEASVLISPNQTPVPVRITSGTISTYGAATSFSYAANGTDIFTISGSNTKTIKIKHISIDGTQNATATRVISLIKRSTANTGGTSTIITNVPFDSLNAPATAVVRFYSVNPTTLGTSVGTFHNEKVVIGAATAAVEDALVFSTTDVTIMQDITLRGANEFLCVNMGGVTSTGNSMNIDITWTEE